MTATAVEMPVGFRKRRVAPAVDVTVEGVRVGFLSAELVSFFDQKTDLVESSADDGRLYFLYRVSTALPPAAEKALADVPLNSITLLAAARELLTPVTVLPPAAAESLERWFRALS